jgi:glycosyltransferase involved in cell wall biosynthesis
LASEGEVRVAVVVPCYDDGATLPETLASVEEQEPCELVVVNDGSTDPATLRVLEEAAARGVRVVHQENRGLSGARSAGVAATSARYVFPLDADDQLAAGALTALADALDASPDAAAAWGDVVVFGDTSLYYRPPRALDPWAITYFNELVVGSMFRRDALLAVGGWQLRDAYEDWDLWMALAEDGRTGIYVPGAMFRYRIHGSRMWRDAVARHGRIFDELRRRHERLFAARSRNWRRSPAPLRVRLLVPAISRLPLSEYSRHRLYHVVSRPGRIVRARLGRRR